MKQQNMKINADGNLYDKIMILLKIIFADACERPFKFIIYKKQLTKPQVVKYY